MTPDDAGEDALLVIDAQRAYTDKGSPLRCEEADATIARVNQVIAAFQKARRAVVYVRHEYQEDLSDVGRMQDYGAGGDTPFRRGSRLAEYAQDLKVLRGAGEVVKNRYSAFAGTALKHELDVVNATGVVVTGFMTNFCCESTARAAHDLDYRVTFLPDATGAPALSAEFDQDQIRAIVGRQLAAGFARVVTTDEFLAEARAVQA